MNADDFWDFLEGMAEECGGYRVLIWLGVLLVVGLAWVGLRGY
jgi:hypothetical protein